MPSLVSEAGRFKPASESKVRIIDPDSREWKDLCMGKRLDGIPFVESMIRSGRASLVLLPEPTQTCRQKAKLAKIDPESIVKTLCCREATNPEGRVFLVTSTSAGRMNLSDICGQTEELRYTELALSPQTLPSMAPGTCTPFVPTEDVSGVELFMVQTPESGLGDKMVDVSIGGTDTTSFCLSLSLRYNDLVGSLSSAYGEKVRFFSREGESEQLPGRIEEQLRVLRGDPRHPKRYGPRLKAVRRLESILQDSKLDKMEKTLIISELNMVDGHGRVMEEARRLALKLARGMEVDS